MQTLISNINGVDIVTVDRDGEIFVPIKPICEAIGIDVESQRDKIQADEILNSVAVFCTATGADGKQYEMHCLPLRYTYGWLFTINPKRSPRPPVRLSPDIGTSVTMCSTSISPAPCSAQSPSTTPRLRCSSKSTRLLPARKKPRPTAKRLRKLSTSSDPSA